MERKGILIIDDERSFTELVRMNLEMSGKFQVAVANDGRDGIAMAKDLKPDVILLDVMMPKMDGFEVLNALKKNPKTLSIPVIMLSAKSDDASKIAASSLYSQYYVTKPIDADELVAKIEWVLNLSGKKK